MPNNNGSRTFENQDKILFFSTKLQGFLQVLFYFLDFTLLGYAASSLILLKKSLFETRQEERNF